MSQMLGMDIQGVRQLAQQMTQKAQEISQIASTLSTALGSVQWVGQDATNFRSEWDGSLRTQLQNVVQALEDASNKATTNANEQEATSAR